VTAAAVTASPALRLAPGTDGQPEQKQPPAALLSLLIS